MKRISSNLNAEVKKFSFYNQIINIYIYLLNMFLNFNFRKSLKEKHSPIKVEPELYTDDFYLDVNYKPHTKCSNKNCKSKKPFVVREMAYDKPYCCVKCRDEVIYS